jgi:hypothetical protein
MSFYTGKYQCAPIFNDINTCQLQQISWLILRSVLCAAPVIAFVAAAAPAIANGVDHWKETQLYTFPNLR